MPTDLIYDIGMNNGDDTAFYLSRGFRVVAIEADPVLAGAARERFRHEVEAGRLTVVNVGIADRDGEAEFWICDTKSEWNSFDRASASRNDSSHHSLKIPVKRFASILAEYGVPHFLKVDIEGYDDLCLKDLDTVPLPDRPRFISWENWDESISLADGQARGDTAGGRGSGLDLASELGYSRFKLIDQSTLSALSQGLAASNLIDSAARKLGRLFSRGDSVGRRMLHAATQRGRLERQFGRAFPMGSSGPWGDETPGRWLTRSEARAVLMSASKGFPAVMRPRYSLDWFDWHAAR